MTKMSVSANKVSSRLSKEQNHYKKIRIGDDPEYALAQKGRCLCGCGDIVLNRVWNQEAYHFLK